MICYDLFSSVLGTIKFKQKPIAFSADINEMFHQERTQKEDQPAQRFLQRDESKTDQKEPLIYVMNVMIFSVLCSLYAAQDVKNSNILETRINKSASSRCSSV